MAIQPTIRISSESYFKSVDYQDNDLIQLVHGEVIVTMPPTIPRHQEIVGEIFFMLMTIAKSSGRSMDITESHFVR